MAIYKDGPSGHANGKHGNMVYYLLNGQQVGRTAGYVDPSTYTDNQFAVRQKTALINPLIKATRAFLKPGFTHAPKPLGWNYYALATSVNNPHAITGTYPDQEIDFSKVQLSGGAIAPPAEVTVVLKDNVIEATWAADLDHPKSDPRDQLMMCAYFPEEEKALIIPSGARRTEEKQIFPLPSFTLTRIMHVYLAFLADDRSDASNSVYAGHLIWDNSTANDGNV